VPAQRVEGTQEIEEPASVLGIEQDPQKTQETVALLGTGTPGHQTFTAQCPDRREATNSLWPLRQYLMKTRTANFIGALKSKTMRKAGNVAYKMMKILKQILQKEV
jgi:hypothetical protein